MVKITLKKIIKKITNKCSEINIILAQYNIKIFGETFKLCFKKRMVYIQIRMVYIQIRMVYIQAYVKNN